MQKIKNLYLLLGILITILIFFILELINPYFFLTDDNLYQFISTILEGMRQLFSGNIPAINLHQLMGTKILENGTYAVFYPPMVISYFFAHYIFGNDLLIFEIFTLIHLVLGFILTFIFLNSKIKNNLICLLASFAFIFSGYFTLMRAWYYVAPILIFLPLIFFLNDRLKKPGFKTPVFLGLIRGIFFYAGNAQYFVYLIIFELIYFLIRHYQNNWKDFAYEFKKYCFSWLISIIIIFPLGWSQLKTAQASARGGISPLEYLLSRGAYPTDSILGSLIFPLILGSGFLFKYSLAHYSGTIFALLFFVGGIFLIKKYKRDSFKLISPLFWCGILAIVLSWGVFGIIYSFGVLIPFLSSFRDPYKLIPFVNFFVVSFGAIIFSKLIEKKYFKKRLIVFVTILFSILLLASSVVVSQKMDYLGNNSPVDNSIIELKNLKQGRFITIVTNTSLSPKISSNIENEREFLESSLLNRNFASYFGLDHISGKDPFKDKLTETKIPVLSTGISNKHLNLSTLKEYGVKYFVVPKKSLNFHTELENLTKIYENKIIFVLEQKNVKDYVFYGEGDLNYTRKDNGFEFKTNFEKKTNVTINLLHKNNYVAKINENKVQIYKDNLGRMIIEVPKGENKIGFFYIPQDFLTGILISVLLIIMFIYIIKNRKKLENIYSKIHFKKFFKFVGKNKWKIFFLILILALVLIYKSLTAPANIENLIESKFNIETNIKDFSINPMKNEIIFSETNLSKNNKEIFSAKNSKLKLNIKKSFKESFNSKSPRIYFSKVSFSEILIDSSTNKNQDTTCNYIMNFSYPKYLENFDNFKLGKNNLILEDVLFIPTNKMFFEFENEMFNLTEGNFNKEIKISGDINLERYLNGEISLDDGTENVKKQQCIIFPIEEKNSVFY